MPPPPTIDQVLERLPMLRGTEVITSPMPGGHMNASFLVRTDDGSYVVRIPAPAGEILGIDRENERHNSEMAARAGVGPAVVASLDDWGVNVSRYVPGRTMSDGDLRSREQIVRIAETLQRLHAGPRFLRAFDMFERVERWLGTCRDRGIAPPAGLPERMDELRRAHRALASTPVPLVPCHNDLAADNFIDDGQRLWIVDYEYSGNNDPCYDVGGVADLSLFDEDLRALLCEAYFGSADPRLLARMTLHALIADVGWAVWAAIQAETSTLAIDYPAIVEEFRTAAVEILDGPAFGPLLRDASGGAV